MKSWKKLLSAVLAMVMVLSIVPVDVRAAELTNLARGKSATASGSEVASLGASNAVDGDTSSKSSRWSSPEAAGPHWVAIDLGEEKTFESVRIFWEMRKANNYSIQVSNDGTNYTNAKVINGRPSALEDVIVMDAPVTARFVRLYITSFTPEDPDGGVTWNTVSIYEMEIYDGVYTKPVAPIDAITVELPENGDKLIVNLPESDDFEVAYNGTDYEQVIGEDLTIYEPIVDTTVKVSFKSVNKADASDYEFKEIEVTVPGKYTQEAGDNAAPVVLPELREWKGYTGTFAPAENAKVVIESEELKGMAEAFAADYEDLFGKEMEIAVGKADSVKAGEFFFALTKEDKGLDEEGYLMEIKDKVTVEAEDATGAYWATRTILQALKSGDMTIPQGITRDYPLYKVRGLVLDVGRKTFTMDFLKQAVKQMSWFKMNDFHIHLNDNYIFLERYTRAGKDPMTAYSGFRLESDIKAGDKVTLAGKEFTYSADLTNKDVFYTKDEFRSFIEESDVLGVNIVPEFDAPAHSLAFTKVLPELRTGTNGRQNDHLDLANQYDASYDFITNVFDEYLLGENPVFSDETVVHIGADEYEADGNAFRKFCNDMADYVESTGRTARIWGSLTQIKGTLVNGKPSVAVDGTGIQMNLWNAGWANMKEMYELGFDLIDTDDGTYYIVPNAGYYYDYLGASNMYNDALNRVGNTTIPAGDPQILGGAYAIWNDMIDEIENGVSEYDIYDRMTSNMGLFAAKSWGKGSMTQAEAAKVQKMMGDAPNTDFHYAVEADKEGNVLNWDYEALTKFDAVKVDFAQEDDKLAAKFNGGESYLETEVGTLGLDNSLTVVLKRTSSSTEDQILFESAYGSIKAVQGSTGKVGITRENRDYSFNYELPVGEWVELTIKNEYKVVSLYVNGELVDVIGDNETVLNNNNAARPLLATCMLPLDKIGSTTNAFEGFVASVAVTREPVIEYYDYNKVTVTASSEEVNGEDAPAAYVSDGDDSTFWHSEWSDRIAPPPHWVQLELADVTKLDQLVYVPRQNGTNGIFTGYKVEVSLDGAEWTVVATGTWAEDATAKVLDLEPVDAKFVKLTATSSRGDYGSAAEIKLHVYEETPVVPEKDPVTEVFSDVAEGAWYVDAVQYVYDKGIMTGNDGLFSPDTDVTRAVMVETLYKMEGKPEVTDFTAYNDMTDVAADGWYKNSVAWGMNNNIVTGDTYFMTFSPEANVTREQLASFLYRYAQFKGVDTTLSTTVEEVLGGTYVADWAKEAFAWAIDSGIIKGAEVTGADGVVTYDLNPQGTATRAQLATMLCRFLEGAN